MTKIPSVKGSVFTGAVEDVKKLFAAGKLTRSEATRWLLPDDFALLDAALSVASWYDIRAYDRLNLLLRDVAGDGDDEYLRELGRESARRLGQAGVYSQLEYLNRTQVATTTDVRARFEAFGRDLRLLGSITGSIYNFLGWSLEVDPAHALRYRIVWTNAEPISDLTRVRAEGFINEMASVHGHPDLWVSTRVGPDVIHFRMRFDL